MLNIKIRKFIIAGVAAIVLVAPFAVLAVNNVSLNGPVNFEFNIIDAPFSSTTLVGQTGGAVTDITVNASNMLVTLDDGTSSIRFDKTDGLTYFKITEAVPAPANSYSISPTCPDSYAIITGAGLGSVQLKVEMTTVKPGCLALRPGGGQPDLYPLNYSVNINSGATCSLSNSVTLNLACDNASEVLISNDPNFTGATWNSFSVGSVTWVLAPGDGARTVYVEYKSSSGRISPVLSASITINSAGCQVIPPPPPPPPPPGACTFDCNKVSYDLYLVNPDGTERHMGTNYVRVVNNAKDVYTYYFEDKTDFNYQDAIVKVDKSSCGTIIATLISSNSAWHHQIKMKLYYGGALKEDLTLWADDKAVGDLTQTLDLNNFSSLCEQQTQLQFGDLLKGSAQTVYYYASDGKRYVFPNPGTYKTWYSDYSRVVNVSDSVLATFPMGKNVTYRPGVRMVKITTDPKVYAVDSHGTLRWVLNEQVATALYGANWQFLIDDVSDAFFVNYTSGANINGLADFNPPEVTAAAGDIEQDLGLK